MTKVNVTPPFNRFQHSIATFININVEPESEVAGASTNLGNPTDDHKGEGEEE